ncbi:MAG: hypothetical protein ACLPRE_09135 [Limisphaerales bacterium]
MWLAHLSQRHGIDEIDVARNERGKSLLGMAAGVLAQQGQVVIHDFTPYIYARP